MPLTKIRFLNVPRKQIRLRFQSKLSGDTVLMRTPSIAEWRRINANHAKTMKDESVPPMDVMAEAVGACLCDSEGHRLFKRDEEKTISDTFEFSVFMEIYQACWTNILQRTLHKKQKKPKPT